MKNKFLLTIFAILVVAFIVPVPALALDFAAQDPEPVFTLDNVFESVKNAVGFALLLPALLNLGKSVGRVKDGDAPKLSLIFNTGVLVLFVGLQLSGKADLIPVIDQSAGLFANLLVAFTLLLSQLWASRKVHEEVLAGLPVIGKSLSGRHAGEGALIETFVTKEDDSAKSAVFDEDQLKDFRG